MQSLRRFYRKRILSDKNNNCIRKISLCPNEPRAIFLSTMVKESWVDYGGLKDDKVLVQNM